MLPSVAQRRSFWPIAVAVAVAAPSLANVHPLPPSVGEIRVLRLSTADSDRRGSKNGRGTAARGKAFIHAASPQPAERYPEKSVTYPEFPPSVIHNQGNPDDTTRGKARAVSARKLPPPPQFHLNAGKQLLTV